MAQAVTMYSWDDPGAPQLTNAKPSELIDILKKCCVDGYGSKAALGWELLHDDTTLLAIKNNVASGGSGGIVQFRARSDSDTAKNVIYINGGTGFVGPDEIHNKSYQKAMQCQSDWTAWVLVGTGSAFYFIIGNPSEALANYDRKNEEIIFIGDISSFIAADAGRFTVFSGGNEHDITASNLSSYKYSWDYAVSCYSSTYTTIKLLGLDGSSPTKDFIVRPLLLPTAARDSPKISLPSDHFQPFYITTISGGNISGYNSTIRGVLPGLVNPLASWQENEFWPQFHDIEGQQYIAIRSVTRSVKCYLNIESW